jgi:WXG100 family type VII secretion target
MVDGDYVKVDNASLEMRNEAMRKIARVLDGRLDALRSELDSLTDTWTGPSKEEYQVQRARWDNAVQELNRILHEITGKVDDARNVYLDTEVQLARRWGNL